VKKLLAGLVALGLLGLAVYGGVEPAVEPAAVPTEANTTPWWAIARERESWEPFVVGRATASWWAIAREGESWEPFVVGRAGESFVDEVRAFIIAQNHHWPDIIARFSHVITAQVREDMPEFRFTLRGFRFGYVAHELYIRDDVSIATEIHITGEGFEQTITDLVMRDPHLFDRLRLMKLNNGMFLMNFLNGAWIVDEYSGDLFWLWDDEASMFVENEQLRQLAYDLFEGYNARAQTDENGHLMLIRRPVHYYLDIIDGEFVAVKRHRLFHEEIDSVRWDVREIFLPDENGEFALTEIRRSHYEHEMGAPRTIIVDDHITWHTEEIHKLIDGEMQLYSATRTELNHGYYYH